MRAESRFSSLEPFLELKPKDWLICLGVSVVILASLIGEIILFGMPSLGKLAGYVALNLFPPFLVAGAKFVLKPDNSLEAVEQIMNETLLELVLENVKLFQDTIKLQAKYAASTLTWLAPTFGATAPLIASEPTVDEQDPQNIKKLR